MVYLILGNGFEETEAIAPLDCLRRAGVAVTTLGIGGREITGSHGVVVQADAVLETSGCEDLEMLILPGGLGGVNAIQGSAAAMSLIAQSEAAGKWIGAICAAPTILGKLGLLKGKRAVCYPGMEDGLVDAQAQVGTPVVVDGKIITSEAAGSAIAFGLTLVAVLKGRDKAQEIARQIHYHSAF